MLNNLLYISILSLLLSCGGHKGSKKVDRVDFGATLSATGSPLTDNEMAIALRICYALRSKKSLFRSEKIGSDFRFKIENESCKGDKSDEFLNTKLKENGSNLYYESVNPSQSIDYNDLVETHDTANLINICTEVFKGNNPNNTIQMSFDDIFKVVFFNEIYGDGYEIHYGRRQNSLSNDFDLRQMNRFYVLTSGVPAGSYQGLIHVFEKRVRCANNGTQYSTLIQKFVEN